MFMDDNRCCRFPSSYPPCSRVRYHPLPTIPLLRLDLVASDYTLQGFARNSVVAVAARHSSQQQLQHQQQLAAAGAAAAATARSSSCNTSSSSQRQQQQQQQQQQRPRRGGRGHILALRSSDGRTHGGTWSWAASSVWRARAANDSSSGGVCASRGATGPPRALACAAF